MKVAIRKPTQPAPTPSDILDYFRDKQEVIDSGDWDALRINFMDKVQACNNSAWALTENGLSFIAAHNLHKPTGHM